MHATNSTQTMNKAPAYVALTRRLQAHTAGNAYRQGRRKVVSTEPVDAAQALDTEACVLQFRPR